ncbi:MAG: acyltransferase [Flavobacteriaceae bacterium]|nr:acyltransferase [Flavobacteriaceae bacterium]
MRLLKNVISVAYTSLRFVLYKIIYNKRFNYKGIQRFSPNTQIFFLGKSSINLGKSVSAHSGVKIRAIGKGKLSIGNNTSINYGCMIVAMNDIEIGEGVEFGPNVLVYDHDHDFRAFGGIKSNKYKVGVVKIGKNSWIGANVVILRETIIGKNCVVGAGSVISGTYPDNSIITQERKTIVREII